MRIAFNLLSTLMKIAEKLGITMSELMEGVEDTSL